MKADTASAIAACAAILAFISPDCQAQGQPLSIAGNTANSTFNPVTGIIYNEMRSYLKGKFPGTTFTSLPVLGGDLSRYHLIILNRYSSPNLQPDEQAAILNYVLQGGNLLYVGEATGPTNDTFTLPFGIVMTPDPTTNISIAFAAYSNPTHPFLSGYYGAPPNPPSGSYAAQVTVPGASVELARWAGGGIAISAIGYDTLAPGAGFSLFLTDVNMVTPSRWTKEVGPLLANALMIRLAIPPVLQITPVSGGVSLTWDALAVGWILQKSENLMDWSDIGSAITVAGSYTDTTGTAKRFFRLRKPVAPPVP